MSYILDALKKLEQKRQQEGTISLLASQGQTPAKSKPARIWIYLILAALVLNAGIIVWWVGPWKPAAKNRPQKIQAAGQVRVPASPTAAGETVMQTEYVGGKQPSPAKEAKEEGRAQAGREMREPPPKPVATTVQTPPAAGKPQAPQTPAASQKQTVQQKPAPVEQVYNEPPVKPEPKPPKDGRVQRIADLPASISSGLPEFKMSLHYYIADPKARFARINDKTLREGDFLAEGLKVDEVTAAGVIMNCRGWRFLLRISNEK